METDKEIGQETSSPSNQYFQREGLRGIDKDDARDRERGFT